jgi:hypothetical protein
MKINNMVHKWAKDLNRHRTTADVQMANKHIKQCSTCYSIREMQIKTMMRYYYSLTRMATIQNVDSIKFWQGYGATQTLIQCW